MITRCAGALMLALLLPCPARAQTADLAARSREGTRAMGEGRFEDAAQVYRELLRARPNDPGLLANLGMALAMGGHEADALAPLQRAAALNPQLISAQSFLGSTYLALGQPEKALAPLRRATDLAPTQAHGWYVLAEAYNAVAQEAIGSFDESPADLPWRQLLLADAMMEDGRFIDAFALYRTAGEQLPSMITIHDSVSRIYERTGHRDWAGREAAAAVVSPRECARRTALCEFRAGRYRSAFAAAVKGTDAESRYWRARAASELARAAFKHLETLPDSPERREMRAALARSERRFTDAIAELQAALKFTPDDPALLSELGTVYYFAGEYEKAAATLVPLLRANANDPEVLMACGDALLRLQRIDEAIPVLQHAADLNPSDPAARLTLARALIEKKYFEAAVPLLELDLADDADGSVHVQLARAYKGLGKDDKAAELLARSGELQKAAQQRDAAKAQRAITPPK